MKLFGDSVIRDHIEHCNIDESIAECVSLLLNGAFLLFLLHCAANTCRLACYCSFPLALLLGITVL